MGQRRKKGYRDRLKARLEDHINEFLANDGLHIARFALRMDGPNVRFSGVCIEIDVDMEEFYAQQFLEHCAEYDLSTDLLYKKVKRMSGEINTVVGLDTARKKQKIMLRGDNGKIEFINPLALVFLEVVND